VAPERGTLPLKGAVWPVSGPVMRPQKAPQNYDGFTAKDIPHLIRMAQNDAGAGRYEEARREFDFVLRLDPSNSEAKIGLKKLGLTEQEAR